MSRSSPRARGALIFMIGAAWTGIAGSVPVRAEEGADQLTLADLAAYREALAGKATAENARAADPPIPATFRDLWNRADAYRGRRVEVRGRIERIFRQGAVGRFPALVQVWAFTPSGDPFCLVHPADPGSNSGSTPAPGADSRFTGTFLKLVEYPAEDGSRLAPLIVGDRPPQVVKPSPAPPGAGVGSNSGSDANNSLPMDWIAGLLAALGVAAVLGLRHVRFRAGVAARERAGAAETDPLLEFVVPDGDDQRTGGTP